MDENDLSAHDLLIQLAKSDEQRRFETMHILYLRFMPFLHGYSMKHGLSDDDATSASHDTLQRIYDHRHCYDACKGTAEGWIWSIHTRIVIDWLRKKRSDPPMELLESYPSPDHTSPEWFVERKDYRERVQRAWDRLDEYDQRVIQQKRKPGPKSKELKKALERFRLLLSEETK